MRRVREHVDDAGAAKLYMYQGGKAVKAAASFRQYDSFAQSFEDYVSFLQSNGRYETARAPDFAQ